MKNFNSFDTLMKIMMFLLVLVSIVYISAIIYDNYCPKDLIFDIHIPEDTLETPGPDDIVTLEDLSDEEISKTGFFEEEPDQSEPNAQYKYSIEKPIRNTPSEQVHLDKNLSKNSVLM